MLRIIISFYRLLFARKILFRLNKLIYMMSLRGMGVLNYENNSHSGENNFLHYELEHINDGIVLDVGANLGGYCSAIRELYKDCTIYAFEPHPKTYNQLEKNTKNFNIKSLNLGVGASDGTLVLYDYASNDGSQHASLYKGVIEKIHNRQAVEHSVKVIAIDDFIAEKEIKKVYLLKIDTEGHEYEVLKGAKLSIKSGVIDIIHLEFNEMNVISRVFFKDIWDFLPNYDLYRMLPDGLVPIKNYDPVFCEMFAYQNIVAKLKVHR